MPVEPASPAQGYYPERPDEPEPLIDRWLAHSRFLIESAFSRRPPDVAAFAAAVAGHAKRFSIKEVAARLPDLRYRLRRDGLRAELVAECFGAYQGALSAHCPQFLSADVLGAALFMVRDGIAALREARDRAHSLGLAAFTHALRGAPAHVMSASDARAGCLAALLRPPLETLGFAPGHVTAGMSLRARRDAYSAPLVCAAYREFASDYLRDRLHLGRSRGRLSAALGAVAAEGPGAERLMLAGLQCALVEDADVVMLDDALVPIAISAEADESQSRLLYEQALELARALEPESHFRLEEDGAVLTATGMERLARLVTPLGGIWAAPLRRNELIETALDVLHVLKRDRDYRVEGGQVLFPELHDAGAGETVQTKDSLRKLVEIKEGCRSNVRRDVLARISVPRFFNRYLSLGGTCAGVHGAARGLWELHQRRALAFGVGEPVPGYGTRVFTSGTARWAAAAESTRARTAEGAAVVIAVRSPDQAQAGMAALAAAGIKATPVRSAGDDAGESNLAAADTPGGVVLVLHPAERMACYDALGRAPRHVIIAELRPSVRELAHLVRAFGATSCEMMLSLDDRAMEPHLGKRRADAIRNGSGASDELPSRQASQVARRIQRSAENAHALARRDLQARDTYLRDFLAVSGARD